MRLVNHPILCNYYLTYRCNAKCSFCDIWEKPSPYINLEDVTSNFHDLKKLGVKVIDFTGGEPLLHQQIDEILALAKEMGFITTLTTNCLLYPKWAEKIKGKIDMLHFSLDSYNREEHNKSRGVNCYDFVIDSIQIAKKLGERPDIIFTVFEHNLDQIEKIYTRITEPNGLVLILNPAFDYDTIKTGVPLSSEQLDFLSFWGKKKNVFLNEGFIELRKNGGNDINNPICKAASTTIVISPENKLMLPCYHLGIEEMNINNNLYDLYNSPRVQELIKKEGRYKECKGCTINCYMQPSFSVNLNKYWFYAFPSTIKYNLIKGTWKELWE